MQPPSPRNDHGEGETATGPPSLLVIGASGRALAEAAAGDGLKVDAIDLFCDTDLKLAVRHALQSHDFPHDLPKLARRLPPADWMFTGGLENYSDVIDEICKTHRLLGIRGQPLERVRSINTLFDVVSCPEICRNACAGQLDSPGWLMKPYRSGGGLGIGWTHDDAEFRRRIQAGTHYAQRYVDGQAMSSLFLANGRHAICLASFLAISSEGTWHYQGSIGPITLSTTPQVWVEHVGEKLVDKFQLCGIFGVDWIVDRDGCCFVLEVNPRWTATAELCQRAFGYPLVRWHIDACRGGTLPTPKPPPGAARLTKRILYATREMTFRSDLLEQSECRFRDESPEGVTPQFHWCDLPGDGTVIAAYQPICSVIVRDCQPS